MRRGFRSTPEAPATARGRPGKLRSPDRRGRRREGTPSWLRVPGDDGTTGTRESRTGADALPLRARGARAPRNPARDILIGPDAGLVVQVRCISALFTLHAGMHVLQEVESAPGKRREAVLEVAVDLITQAHRHTAGD
ncbi:hypothetical protein GA0115245_112414 [Streptomyces sp. di188]|nr:hypothetical protein GA0115238_120214 [Streptomyces sp. di50b]SCD73942.1 hypothetical protein GA0115245_112414 [Streptomyces sp. di188]